MNEMANHKIAEIFLSINGEGPRVGELAVFVRFAGCNLDCSYCDTRWANEEGGRCHRTSTEEIMDLIRQMSVRNVTVTGGEPLIQPDIEEFLCAMSNEPGLRIEIETNGTVSLLPFIGKEKRLFFTMDYKLPGSGMSDKMIPENLELLGAEDAVKFVISDLADLRCAQEVIEKYKLRGKCHVFLSPVYKKMDPEEIVSFMKRHHLNDVRLQLQMHKTIWGGDMRGV